MITRNLLTRSYKLLLTLLVLLMSTNAFAQRLTATGKVTDAAGLEVIGASVLEKGTANGVVTNLDGEFSLSVGQNATLVISFIGYKTIEVKATTNMNITLQEDNELLDEVVVIGYGSVKRKDVTTAVSTVSTKDLDQRPIVSAAQALQGKAAGVSVMQPSGEPGGGMSIRVRGTTSFNGSNDPLYVVDGVPATNINFLSANDIESLSILKDASSAAIYGSRAANGVVLITTKAGAEGNSERCCPRNDRSNGRSRYPEKYYPGHCGRRYGNAQQGQNEAEAHGRSAAGNCRGKSGSRQSKAALCRKERFHVGGPI